MRQSLALVTQSLVIVLCAMTPAVAETVIGVGQVHTVTGRNETLQGSFSGVIVAVDGAVVNLDQATIDCSTAPSPRVGVHLTSARTRVHVTGGLVQHCNVGVLLGDFLVSGVPGAGGSRNHINGLTVRNAVVSGGTHFDGDGIAINNGINNRVNDNQVDTPGGIGIRIFRGSDNDIVGNIVRNTPPAIGHSGAALLLQEAIGTTVHGNDFSNNLDLGIWVPSNALNNVLTGNTAINNGTTDVVDQTTPCENTWHGTTFNTLSEADPGCIR